jgi:hypothetical protein
MIEVATTYMPDELYDAVTPHTTYQITIVAQDAEQNKSQASAAFTVKTKP